MSSSNSLVEAAAQEAAIEDGLLTGVTPSELNSRSKKTGLRRGKWTAEEEAYANRLIHEFKAGLLPLTDGTTLRTFLSKLLNCDPMRISKKFVGNQCIGKQVFRRKVQDLEKLSLEQIDLSRRELAELERRFLERVAQTNRSKSVSKSKDGLDSGESLNSNVFPQSGPVAPWLVPPQHHNMLSSHAKQQQQQQHMNNNNNYSNDDNGLQDGSTGGHKPHILRGITLGVGGVLQGSSGGAHGLRHSGTLNYPNNMHMQPSMQGMQNTMSHLDPNNPQGNGGSGGGGMSQQHQPFPRRSNSYIPSSNPLLTQSSAMYFPFPPSMEPPNNRNRMNPNGINNPLNNNNINNNSNNMDDSKSQRRYDPSNLMMNPNNEFDTNYSSLNNNIPNVDMIMNSNFTRNYSLELLSSLDDGRFPSARSFENLAMFGSNNNSGGGGFPWASSSLGNDWPMNMSSMNGGMVDDHPHNLLMGNYHPNMEYNNSLDDARNDYYDIDMKSTMNRGRNSNRGGDIAGNNNSVITTLDDNNNTLHNLENRSHNNNNNNNNNNKDYEGGMDGNNSSSTELSSSSSRILEEGNQSLHQLDQITKSYGMTVVQNTSDTSPYHTSLNHRQLATASALTDRNNEFSSSAINPSRQMETGITSFSNSNVSNNIDNNYNNNNLNNDNNDTEVNIEDSESHDNNNNNNKNDPRSTTNDIINSNSMNDVLDQSVLENLKRYRSSQRNTTSNTMTSSSIPTPTTNESMEENNSNNLSQRKSVGDIELVRGYTGGEHHPDEDDDDDGSTTTSTGNQLRGKSLLSDDPAAAAGSSSSNNTNSNNVGEGLIRMKVKIEQHPTAISNTNKGMPKNSSVENFWMLVANGDLPHPEQNVLSAPLFNPRGGPLEQQLPYSTPSATTSSSATAAAAALNIRDQHVMLQIQQEQHFQQQQNDQQELQQRQHLQQHLYHKQFELDKQAANSTSTAPPPTASGEEEERAEVLTSSSHHHHSTDHPSTTAIGTLASSTTSDNSSLPFAESKTASLRISSDFSKSLHHQQQHQPLGGTGSSNILSNSNSNSNDMKDSNLSSGTATPPATTDSTGSVGGGGGGGGGSSPRDMSSSLSQFQQLESVDPKDSNSGNHVPSRRLGSQYDRTMMPAGMLPSSLSYGHPLGQGSAGGGGGALDFMKIKSEPPYRGMTASMSQPPAYGTASPGRDPMAFGNDLNQQDSVYGHLSQTLEATYGGMSVVGGGQDSGGGSGGGQQYSMQGQEYPFTSSGGSGAGGLGMDGSHGSMSSAAPGIMYYSPNFQDPSMSVPPHSVGLHGGYMGMSPWHHSQGMMHHHPMSDPQDLPRHPHLTADDQLAWNHYAVARQQQQQQQQYQQHMYQQQFYQNQWQQQQQQFMPHPYQSSSNLPNPYDRYQSMSMMPGSSASTGNNSMNPITGGSHNSLDQQQGGGGGGSGLGIGLPSSMLTNHDSQMLKSSHTRSNNNSSIMNTSNNNNNNINNSISGLSGSSMVRNDNGNSSSNDYSHLKRNIESQDNNDDDQDDDDNYRTKKISRGGGGGGGGDS